MAKKQKDQAKSLEQRLAALEATAHTEHTLTAVSHDLIEQIADLVVVRTIARLNQLIQVQQTPPQESPSGTIEQQDASEPAQE